MGNFRLFDNTNYPQTLDSHKMYSPDFKHPSTVLLSFKTADHKRRNSLRTLIDAFENSQEIPDETAMNFELTIFHYPLDKGCPIQREEGNQKFDKLVKMRMKQLQIVHMQEVMFRLNDYVFYQLISAMTDVNPYQDIISRLKNELDPFVEDHTNHKDQSRLSLFKIRSSRLLERIDRISRHSSRQSGNGSESSDSDSQKSSSHRMEFEYDIDQIPDED